MSFSNPGYSAGLQAAIDYAWSHDVVVVAAAGNDGSSAATFPAGDLGVIGVADRPRRLPSVEAVLNGQIVDEATIAKAEAATHTAVDPQDDIHASAAYRAHVVTVLAKRAVASR